MLPEQLRPEPHQSQDEPDLVSLGDDAEIKSVTQTLAGNNEGFSLEALMEESGIVIKGLPRAGEWKLDQRIAEACQDENSEKYLEVVHLVELIEQYDELHAEADSVESDYELYHRYKQTYEALCLIPSALGSLVLLKEGFQVHILFLLVLSYLLTMTLLRMKHIEVKILNRTLVSKDTWDKIEEESAKLDPIQDDIDDVYYEIAESFKRLGISWYLRDNVFDEALNRIATVYHNETFTT